MITKVFLKKRLWLMILSLLMTSSVNAELVDVGPMDRIYEYLFFDGHIESGTNELNIFSGINDNGIWKASTSVNNDWKTASTAAWQDAVVVYNPGKPEDLVKDESTQAQFIWAPNSDGSNNGENGPTKAYFSYTFNLDKSLYFSEDGKFAGTASSKVLADDFFAMSVNGHFVKNGLLDTQITNNTANNGLGLPVDVPFADWLQVGSNTISIFAYDGYKLEKEDFINSNTVLAAPSGDTMEITFTPSDAGKKITNLKEITISDAADILGYDHFNWYQVGSNTRYPGNPLPNCYPYSTPICTDPPINYLDTANTIWNSNSADSEPFYWDEFTSKDDQRSYLAHIVDNSFKFYDSPGSPYNEEFTLDTFLVGIKERKSLINDGWIPLYHVNWKTTCVNGVCSIEPNSKRDSDMINLGANVKACMVNDGALEPNSSSNILGTDSNVCFKAQDPATITEPSELELLFLGFLYFMFFQEKTFQILLNKSNKKIIFSNFIIFNCINKNHYIKMQKINQLNSNVKLKYWLTGLVLSIFMVSSTLCFGQDTDSNYADFLQETCNSIPPPRPSFCAALPGSGAGAAAGLPFVSNIGLIGSQGRLSNLTAYEQKKSIRRRLDELEEKTEEQGGGASADWSFGSFGTFVTFQHSGTDRQTTTLENGFLSELNGVLGGMDYRFMDNLVAGVTVGYSNTNANFFNQAGGLDTANINSAAYVAYNPTENTTVDGYFGYASLTYDSLRKVNFGRVNDTATGRANGDQYLAGASASYGWQVSALTLSPQIKVDYSNTHIDAFTETGSQLNSIFGSQNIRSLRGSVGGIASYAISVPWGILLPQFRAHYVHEFKDPSRDISISLAALPTAGFTNPTDNPDRDFFTWGGGVSTVMAHGLQMFVDYEQLSGNFIYNVWTVSAGFRAEF